MLKRLGDHQGDTNIVIGITDTGWDPTPFIGECTNKLQRSINGVTMMEIVILITWVGI